MRWLFRDIRVKLICLLLAFGLWIFVAHLRQESSASRPTGMMRLRLVDVPVQLQGTDAARLSVTPDHVTVTVQWRRGTAVTYESLQRIYAVIPTEVTDTQEIYTPGPTDIVLPPGWMLLEVSPAELKLSPLSRGEDK